VADYRNPTRSFQICYYPRYYSTWVYPEVNLVEDRHLAPIGTTFVYVT